MRPGVVDHNKQGWIDCWTGLDSRSGPRSGNVWEDHDAAPEMQGGFIAPENQKFIGTGDSDLMAEPFTCLRFTSCA
jgi:hypothetical protein